MRKIMSPREAISMIRDGDTIGINAFLALANPEALHQALAERIAEAGRPKDLTLFCTTGFGAWGENQFADPYVKLGAVRKVVAGHFGSMPEIVRQILDEQIEGYNMPQGVMTSMQRAAAQGNPGTLSSIGLNLFVDPRIEGPGMNSISKEEWVTPVEVDGKPYLFYKSPQIDIAFLRGTSADPRGNITFEKEACMSSALSLAQAAKANNGKVIVQVERLVEKYPRPHSVVIPGMLVDAIVVYPQQQQVYGAEYNPSLAGDIRVEPQEMDYWLARVREVSTQNATPRNITHRLIGRRAQQELRKGDVVNIGAGIPEEVGPAAEEAGMLSGVTLTVESGTVGGLPAPGIAFGATIGPDCVYDMSQQFDFYDGGGLDICFVGALEIDGQGNVNCHRLDGRLPGIGGFANLTQTTPKVVFCANFSSGGLEAQVSDGCLTIEKEGKFPKFVKEVSHVSFSSINARNNRQTVLYITERCVFRLCDTGLELCEVAPGVDIGRDILDQLPFEVTLAKKIKKMDFNGICSPGDVCL